MLFIIVQDQMVCMEPYLFLCGWSMWRKKKERIRKARDRDGHAGHLSLLESKVQDVRYLCSRRLVSLGACRPHHIM